MAFVPSFHVTRLTILSVSTMGTDGKMVNNTGLKLVESDKYMKLDYDKQEIPSNQYCPVCINTDFCKGANRCDPNPFTTTAITKRNADSEWSSSLFHFLSTSFPSKEIIQIS
ncbi:hypothetical protein LOAG_05178 [Loa loa]|uniref:Uncharacterized protein n=1 Tax=Loa loa TaxID=7209 RepID=A0A1S0U0F1_LOALO|nr:hypothetical protein LOAG_05178 [Loa loa]EFO23308.1 hypothetical protein LOAG_05178 [Loa loa]